MLADAARALLEADLRTSRSVTPWATWTTMREAVDCLEPISSFSPSISIAAPSMPSYAPWTWTGGEEL